MNALRAAVAQVMDRFNAAVLAYCMMGKHCHFLLHTHRAKLSRLLRHLNLKTAATSVPRPSARVLEGLLDQRFAD